MTVHAIGSSMGLKDCSSLDRYSNMRIRDWRISFIILLLCMVVELSWGDQCASPLLVHSDADNQREFQNVYQCVQDEFVGVANGSNATAGHVGEYIFSVFPSGGPFGNGVWGDESSINLTAGDWDITLVEQLNSNGSDANMFEIGISTTSGNSTSGLSLGDNLVESTVANSLLNQIVPSWRFSSTASFTIYAKARLD